MGSFVDKIRSILYSGNGNGMTMTGEPMDKIVINPPLKNTNESYLIEKFKVSPDEYTKHEDEHWTHIIPHTETASKKYGANTKWCTAAKENNAFNGYNEKGKLHIFIPKKPNYPGEKYAIHNELNQYQNEKNKNIGPQGIFKNRAMPHSYKEHLDNMMKSNDIESLRALARHGYKEHLDKLVNHDDPNVLVHVARHGYKEHLDKLVNHPNWLVANAVAKYGHKEHLDKLVNYPDWVVASTVAKRGYKEHLDKLVNHPHWAVVRTIARERLQELNNQVTENVSDLIKSNNKKQVLKTGTIIGKESLNKSNIKHRIKKPSLVNVVTEIMNAGDQPLLSGPKKPKKTKIVIEGTLKGEVNTPENGDDTQYSSNQMPIDAPKKDRSKRIPLKEEKYFRRLDTARKWAKYYGGLIARDPGSGLYYITQKGNFRAESFSGDFSGNDGPIDMTFGAGQSNQTPNPKVIRKAKNYILNKNTNESYLIEKFKVSPDEYTKHEDEHWTHVIPHTETASKKYGANTKWCTAAKEGNQFNNYNENGKLHIFIPKKPIHPGEKYAIHNELNQYQNEKNENIGPQGIFKDRPMPHSYKEHLDNMMKSNDPESLKVVARHGHKEHLDKLFNHNDPDVLAYVARHGHKEHLDKLVNHPYWRVALEVADRGHKEHLDKLVNHHDPDVLRVVARHGHKEHLDKLANHPDWEVASEVAKHGHKEHLDKVVNHPDWRVALEVAKHGHKEHLDKLFNHNNPYVLAHVAKRGYKEHLDKLVNHNDPYVLAHVAKHGYKEHLDKLVNHNDPDILGHVAERGYKEHLDKLANHNDPYVLAHVAERGYKEHLDKLLNHNNPDVLVHVAKHGYKEHLDKLANHYDLIVRNIARGRLHELNNQVTENVNVKTILEKFKTKPININNKRNFIAKNMNKFNKPSVVMPKRGKGSYKRANVKLDKE